MAEFRKSTKVNISQHLRNLATYCEEDEYVAKEIAKWFNSQMDDFLEQDFFGTEGQCDPRGDHRD